MSLSVLNIEVIEEKLEWQNLLNRVKYYDFYHTYDYHQLSKAIDEKPILIKYEDNGTVIGLPLLLRKIFDTEYYDVTSVYGYAGPLHNNIDASFDNSDFISQLNQFFYEKKVVSVFSRLNPFIKNQEAILGELGDLIELGKVVNIDLTQDVDTQRSVFSKTTKRYINKGRRLCSIRHSNSKEDISAFIKLYYENMDRVNAKKNYYFTEEYFDYFINSDDFQTDVLLATYNETNEIISAAMMVKTNDIVQYHISGTRNDYLYLTPIRILIDEMRINATSKKYKYFNLGGGLGASEDSLFRFKSSFSKDYKVFKVWKYIVNQEIYDQLTEQYATLDNETDFFPLYRAK
ncbi:GNAT family N-acetyltransferase [Aquimarina mytili]|uniref:Peptidoglycan bridge formation glycyltransferase FemA/FemB family protein n=1 Tax=Aquimarina mytili TaxID=874423 RepID=A0A936ZRV5_9FLAO|nr:GNAT family N-acetyltransferase [Aquimarina mytili]MBL0683167.1 peptidoglycan bridge formation glycyltransferase FemA/FemB family protein [Aquimarina mytili]